MRTLGTILLGVFLLSATFTVPQAAAQTDSTTLYALGTRSNFQWGCFAPCACPVFSIEPIRGTFRLKPLGFDGLFDNYAISDIQWTAPDNAMKLTITGSGLYRIGGEVAIQKQMTLDLNVGGNPTQHFDSGLIGGTYDFPRIEIDVSLRGMVCFDSAFHVQAAPATPSGIASEIGTPRVGSVRAVPNPFARETSLLVALPSASSVDLAIFDAQGRLVRRLVRGEWLAAGTPSVLWDGRRDDGEPCASGIYFLRARIGDRTALSRLVRAR